MKNWTINKLPFILLAFSLLVLTSCGKSIFEEYENYTDDPLAAMNLSVYSDDVKCEVITESPTLGTIVQKGTRCFYSDKENCGPTTACNTDATFMDLINSYYTDEQWYEDLVNGVPYTEPEILAYIEAHFRE
jgi:hypothetical protein